MNKLFIFCICFILGFVSLLAQEVEKAGEKKDSGNNDDKQPKGIIIANDTLDVTNFIEILQKELEISAKKRDTVRTSRRPYIISIGTSFSLIEGLDPNSIYGDLEIYKPNLWKIPQWALLPKIGRFPGLPMPSLNLGLNIGLSNTKSLIPNEESTSSPDRVSDIMYVDPPRIVDPATARYERITTTYERVVDEEAEDLTLFSTLLIETKSKHIDLLLHGEVRKRNTKFIFTDSLVSSRTDSVDQFSRIPPTDVNRLRNFSALTYQVFFGGGFMIDVVDSKERVAFSTKVVFGVSPENRRVGIVDGMVLKNVETRFSFLIQFDILEQRSDLRFGGEIRGTDFDAPEIGIYLTKDFPLSFLGKFFTPSKD